MGYQEPVTPTSVNATAAVDVTMSAVTSVEMATTLDHEVDELGIGDAARCRS